MNEFVMDNESNNLGNIFDKHLEFEFDKEDVDATMTNYDRGSICSQCSYFNRRKRL
jgi:hypothetical protein